MSTATNTSDSRHAFRLSTSLERAQLGWRLESAERRLKGTDRGPHIPDSLGDRVVRSLIALHCLWIPTISPTGGRAILDEAHQVLQEFEAAD